MINVCTFAEPVIKPTPTKKPSKIYDYKWGKGLKLSRVNSFFSENYHCQNSIHFNTSIGYPGKCDPHIGWFTNDRLRYCYFYRSGLR